MASITCVPLVRGVAPAVFTVPPVGRGIDQMFERAAYSP